MKTKPDIAPTGEWNSTATVLWWFCLLLVLILILLSSTSYGQGSITGFTWMDENKNGRIDAGERQFSGVRVQLFRQLGANSFEELSSLRTESDGSYRFLISNLLLPSDFYLQFEAVSGMYRSPANLYSDELIDSDADTSTGRTSLFTLANLGNAEGWNAGYMTSPSDPPQAASANLAVSFSVSSDTIHVGDPVDFLLHVINQGPDSSLSPVLTMTLPAQLYFDSATPAPADPGANPLSWSLAALAPGEERQVSLRLRVVQEGDGSGAICLVTSTEDPDPADNCAGYEVHGSVPVEINEYYSMYTSRGIKIRWVTASETENMGFHLYRSEERDGRYERITPAMIPGAGTSSSEHTYEYLDTDFNHGRVYYYKLQDIDYSGFAGWHGPVTVSTGQPLAFALGQNYPNPFNSRTRIRFQIPEPGFAEMAIYNNLGQQVNRLFARDWLAGEHEVEWDGSDNQNQMVASGLYHCILRYGNAIEKRTMNLIK